MSLNVAGVAVLRSLMGGGTPEPAHLCLFPAEYLPSGSAYELTRGSEVPTKAFWWVSLIVWVVWERTTLQHLVK